MPLAALIEEKILCVHGGIGITIRTIDEIELIQRPVEISHDPKTVSITWLNWLVPVEDRA
jgi:diadenosine tetraphosphatase ApaH/serine/threonine PP2A family protein phosphatase